MHADYHVQRHFILPEYHLLLPFVDSKFMMYLMGTGVLAPKLGILVNPNPWVQYFACNH